MTPMRAWTAVAAASPLLLTAGSEREPAIGGQVLLHSLR